MDNYCCQHHSLYSDGNPLDLLETDLPYVHPIPASKNLRLNLQDPLISTQKQLEITWNKAILTDTCPSAISTLLCCAVFELMDIILPQLFMQSFGG